MNIINKLTLRHLKKNKSRTVITVLGICVSVAMITAVFVSAASFLKFMGDLSAYSDGNFHAQADDLSITQINSLKTDGRLESVGTFIDLNREISGVRLENRASDRLGTTNIYAGDENNLKQMITCKYDGELPKNENEIAVEEELIKKNQLGWKIGDTVSIALGLRYGYVEIEGGEKDINYYSGGYQQGELFDQKEVSRFTVTAILYDNLPTSEKIIRGLSEAEKTEDISPEHGKRCAALTVKSPNYNSLNDLKEILKSIGAEEYYFNSDLLGAHLAIDSNSVVAKVLIPMVIFILAIIIAASVMLIYNAFGMSVSERTRYLGMLGSVGATKAQKRQSVYFEGFILGIISIPLGIIGGIIGMSITLGAVGDMIASTTMINGIENAGIEMSVVVPVWALIGIVFFSALTIFISSLIPAKKASSLTPIEALRQNKEIKLKAKRLKTPKIVRRVFGYEGELAHKNLKRNGRRARVIVASIAVSVVLFLSVSYFCSMFSREITGLSEMPYQVGLNVAVSDEDSIIKAIEEIEGVDSVYDASNFFYRTSSNNIDSMKFENSFISDSSLRPAYSKLWDYTTIIYVNAVSDQHFNDMCKNNGIDSAAFYGEKPRALLMNNIGHKNGGEVFTENALGTKLALSGDDEEAVEIAGLIDFDENDYACSLNPSGTVSVYVPSSVYYTAFSQRFGDVPMATIGIETKEHAAVTEKIGERLAEEDFASAVYYTYDYAEQISSMSTLVYVLQVFTYGFITLITLVTLANIVNTVSTSIDLRRREFAMYKSVGATQKGFYKMVLLESIFYGLRALIIALPLSLLASYGLNVTAGDAKAPFEIDFPLYLAVIAAVFAVTGVSMLFSASKLKNDGIIEVLSEDIS